VGAFRALAAREKSLTILQLDAHADLREEYQGSPFSHACVMARARELFPCVQVGIRSISAPEFERVRRERLPLFPARRCREDREAVAREAVSFMGPRIYLTIDLDVLDPSILPSTGTPEPGGFRWDEICWFVRELTKDRDVVGFDLMELAPIPGLHAPDFMAAKLLNKVLGLTCPPEGVA
jgi:agmatinase